MIRFIGKRILQMIPVVLLVATLIFGILYLVPGDPAQIMLGSTASEYELAAIAGTTFPFASLVGLYTMSRFSGLAINTVPASPMSQWLTFSAEAQISEKPFSEVELTEGASTSLPSFST